MQILILRLRQTTLSGQDVPIQSRPFKELYDSYRLVV